MCRMARYVDVLVEDQGVLLARIERVSDTGGFTVRYLGPTKRAGVYDFEDTEYDIEAACINDYHDDETTIGYIKVAGGWVKAASAEESSESEYEPTDTDESSESTSLEDSEEENLDEE